MAAMSNDLENALINWFFRAQAMSGVINGATAGAGTGPANVYIGLLTAAPSDTGGGTEVTGNNYARATVAAGTGNWDAPVTDGTTKNTNVISFNTPSGNWGTITHFGIYDTSTNGKLLFWGALSSQKAIFTNDAVSIQAGQLIIQIDD